GLDARHPIPSTTISSPVMNDESSEAGGLWLRSISDGSAILLIGQFAGVGDTEACGFISAYDLATGRFEELLRDASGEPLAINGVWASAPGNVSPNNNDGGPRGQWKNQGPLGLRLLARDHPDLSVPVDFHLLHPHHFGLVARSREEEHYPPCGGDARFMFDGREYLPNFLATQHSIPRRFAKEGLRQPEEWAWRDYQLRAAEAPVPDELHVLTTPVRHVRSTLGDDSIPPALDLRAVDRGEPLLRPFRKEVHLDDASQFLLGARGARGEMPALEKEGGELAERRSGALDRDLPGWICPFRPLDPSQGLGGSFPGTRKGDPGIASEADAAVAAV